MADFTVDAQTAASKAAKDGVAAETQYDLARAIAKRDYNNAVADASLVKITATAHTAYAFVIQTPVDENALDAWLQPPPARPPCKPKPPPSPRMPQPAEFWPASCAAATD